ncbi:hypothetical protein [Rhizorhapis suberifaciens]|uniref:Amino acid permease n=1 Tax=Rhizorhapis suberifaciens TaxID=13656 RepID=A0A840HST7_9SPHN|nr:hypothetical protein [Rhizorhapis suberifaciens]MBB4640628.1 amino acid permease [Rhizorhapis suberifaciens]
MILVRRIRFGHSLLAQCALRLGCSFLGHRLRLYRFYDSMIRRLYRGRSLIAVTARTTRPTIILTFVLAFVLALARSFALAIIRAVVPAL